MRTEVGRLKEAQSVMNWARILGETFLSSILDIGWTLATVFISSGKSLLLTPEVARHDTRTCSVDSVVIMLGTRARHREHAGFRAGWSMARLSLVRK